ncbi:flavin-containing monooxygenase [Pseudarthrobacter sp. NPDC058196]|uniref:flavin-containing monooxygenase n=1 Tax=Pseudarthrobacter sp. NPDC058196 TaxID=3346376 RepID=UPI0036D96920
MTTTPKQAASPNEAPRILDALVIGCGIAGIYQLHKLNQAGLDVRAVDAAEGIGGTWWWNRYPGARFDSPSYLYGFFASSKLYREWRWSERYAGQPEIEAYLNNAVREFGLVDLITLNTRVESMRFDSERAVWTVRTNTGEKVETRFVVPALGVLSRPLVPEITGVEKFAGRVHHTARWPKEPVDLSGKRVAVVGVGASGVQIATEIASEVDELVVFQKSPQWVTPLHNEDISEDEFAQIQDSYDEYHEQAMSSFMGFVETYLAAPGDFATHTSQQRREIFEAVYNMHGFLKVLANYPEVFAAGEANEAFCAFLAEKIRERVKDPILAEKLIPDHPFISKRPPFDSGSGYYEIFNLPHVKLVCTPETPIVRITESGIETTKEHFDLDVIVFATGFHAITGEYETIDIEAHGQKLNNKWADGPQTYLGIQTPGFPNMFFVNGPQVPGGNVPRCAEPGSDLITDLIVESLKRDASVVETTTEDAKAWTAIVAESAHGTALGSANNWQRGANVPGKKPVPFMLYMGGLNNYVEYLNKSRMSGFEGFLFDGAKASTPSSPKSVTDGSLAHHS